jgi:hypothetical protein
VICRGELTITWPTRHLNADELAEALAPSAPGALDTAAQGGAVEAAAEPVAEDVVVRAREVTALRQAGQRSRGLVGERHLAGPPRLRGAGLDGAC